ncbi:hypothetical protein [Phascolarctobacterium faecium]|nr:hypothetical protein [Phascolarctobacterium faecium]
MLAILVLAAIDGLLSVLHSHSGEITLVYGQYHSQNLLLAALP